MSVPRSCVSGRDEVPSELNSGRDWCALKYSGALVATHSNEWLGVIPGVEGYGSGAICFFWGFGGLLRFGSRCDLRGSFRVCFF